MPSCGGVEAVGGLPWSLFHFVGMWPGPFAVPQSHCGLASCVLAKLAKQRFQEEDKQVTTEQEGRQWLHVKFKKSKGELLRAFVSTHSW